MVCSHSAVPPDWVARLCDTVHYVNWMYKYSHCEFVLVSILTHNIGRNNALHTDYSLTHTSGRHMFRCHPIHDFDYEQLYNWQRLVIYVMVMPGVRNCNPTSVEDLHWQHMVCVSSVRASLKIDEVTTLYSAYSKTQVVYCRRMSCVVG